MNTPTKVVWHKLDITTPEFSTFKLRTPLITSRIRLPDEIAQCEPQRWHEPEINLYAFIDVTPIVGSYDSDNNRNYTPGISTLWWFGEWCQVPFDLTNPTTAVLMLSTEPVQACVEIATVWQDMVRYALAIKQTIDGDSPKSADSPFDMVVQRLNVLRKFITRIPTDLKDFLS